MKVYGDNGIIKYIFWRFRPLYLFNIMDYPYTAQVRPGSDNQIKFVEATVLCKALGTIGTILTKITHVFLI